jgi:CheY-like chemotaxis protein
MAGTRGGEQREQKRTMSVVTVTGACSAVRFELPIHEALEGPGHDAEIGPDASGPEHPGPRIPPGDLDVHDGPRRERPRSQELVGSGDTAPIKVTYIEDNLSNQRLVELALSRHGLAEVRLVSDGLDGLASIVADPPDLVLLDLHLPDIDGLEVLRRLRKDERTADLPVVVLSADATPARIKALRDEGAADYLTKPLELAHLRDLVERLGRR